MTIDRSDARYLIGFAGGILVVGGVTALSIAAGVIAAGFLLVALALLMRGV